jgi:hypothetical protein
MKEGAGEGESFNDIVHHRLPLALPIRGTEKGGGQLVESK